jgi:hypothetical protein
VELYELQEIDHEAAKLKWSMMKRQVTEQEVKKLRREIEEQEILIRGLPGRIWNLQVVNSSLNA